MGPLDMSGPAPTGMMANPVLSELDNLSPQAKGALHQAHQTVMQQSAIQPIGAGAPGTQVPGTQPSQPVGASANMPSPMAPQPQHMAMPTPVDSGLQADKTELQRLNSTGSGIDQIKNPIGRTFAHIAEGIGSTFAPGITAAIPGTQLHHNVLLNQANNAVKGDEALQTQQIGAAHQTAETNTEIDKPELAQTKSQLAEEKQAETHFKDAAGIAQQKQKAEDSRREHGFVLDPDGNERPATYAEMDPKNRSLADLNSAREEMQKASKDYKDAQTKGMPQAQQMAMARIQTARQNASRAERSLGIRQAEYNERAFNTDIHNNPLPGAPLTDDNRTVGTGNASNVRPTAGMRNAASKATVGINEIDQAKQLVAANPNLVGPYMGRKNAIQEMIGSQDPQVRQLGQHLANTTQFAMTVHGARGKAVMDKFEHDLSTNTNPAAFTAGLDTLRGSFSGIQGEGTPRTVGSNPPPPPPKAAASQHTIDINGKRYKYKGSGPTESMSSYDEVKK